MKTIILIIFWILITINTVNAWETQFIDLENETISITPIITICENTTNVFKIQRENYSTGMNPLSIKYSQKIIADTNQTKIINISKIINKYTSSNTGEYNTSKNGNNTLIFEISNQSLNWTFQVVCQNTSNQSTNQTVEINNTQINESHEINITINETENLTSENNTIVNQTENNSSIEICPNNFQIRINKEVFEPGEKLEMQFILTPWPETYNITYYIQQLNGKIVKNEYTTTNNKTKSYTVKSSLEKEQTHQIIAVAKTSCEMIEQNKIFVVKNEIDEEEISVTKKDPEININTEIESNNLISEITIKRGDSSKSVVYVNIVDNEGNKLIKEMKISLLNKLAETKTLIKISLPNKKEFTITAEGLDMSKSKTITNTKYEEGKEEKTEHVEMKKEEIINEQKTPEKIVINITKSTNRTKIEPKKESQTTKSRNILFVVAVVLIIGVGVSIYIKKT